MSRAIRYLIWVPVLAAGLGMCVWRSLGMFMDGMTVDADSQTRLAFLRWCIQHGSLESYHFLRDGAPGGMTIHWTLPYDLFAAAAAAPFAAFSGWDRGLLDATWQPGRWPGSSSAPR